MSRACSNRLSALRDGDIMKIGHQFQLKLVTTAALGSVIALAALAQTGIGSVTAIGEAGSAFDAPTNSSPIALDANKKPVVGGQPR